MARRSNTLKSLRSPFLEKLLALESIIRQREIPLIRWETFRCEDRQDMLFARGASKAKWGKSAHNFGLAADYVLDTERVPVRKRAWRGRMFPDAWDNETPEALAAWENFGCAAEELGLEWGGRWGFVDLPHVQLKGWRFLIR